MRGYGRAGGVAGPIAVAPRLVNQQAAMGPATQGDLMERPTRVWWRACGEEAAASESG